MCGFDKISTLDLSKNNLRDEGIIILSETLKQFPSLIHLAVANNEITLKGLEKLCSSLKSNSTLINLDLSNSDALQKNRFTW